MTDALELLADVQLGIIEVDLVPGQAEDFTPAQAEDEDQDEGRVRRFAGVPGRFEKPAGVIAAVLDGADLAGLTSPVPNTTWFRPLEFYTEELRKSGFAITSLTEPHPSTEQVRADSWWRKAFTRPLFMLLVAQKL